jgi:hypothetical protein
MSVTFKKIALNKIDFYPKKKIDFGKLCLFLRQIFVVDFCL